MALNPLTSSERERIDAAIKSAGDRTSADFALVIVPASDRYTLYPPLWAAIIALLATGIVALLRPGYSIRTGFMINGALFAALALVLDWTPIRMLLVPTEVKRRHARELAHREFAVRIVAPGTRRDGVMFFVSIGERYAEILADRDIHALAPAGTWNRIVDEFLAAVKAGRLADGVLHAVEACGAILQEHHPAPNAS
ncbi:MAG TPA: TPM domain-containing protein [Candidatus Acidoferrum sp.]|nr:TPM domain-containing protein [Candidatus Acidoferrum sp.]